MSGVKALIRGTGAAPAPPASLPAEEDMNVGQRCELDVVDGADLTPLGQPSLGEQDVGEQGRLAIADAVADEHRRATASAGVLDRRLLACAAARAGAAPIE